MRATVLESRNNQLMETKLAKALLVADKPTTDDLSGFTLLGALISV